MAKITSDSNEEEIQEVTSDTAKLLMERCIKIGIEFGEVAFDFFGKVGDASVKTVKSIGVIAAKFYHKHLKHHAKHIHRGLLEVTKTFSKIYRTILSGFYNFLKFFVDAKNVVVKGYNKKPTAGVSGKLLNSVKAFFSGVKNNGKIFVTAVNYTLPIVAVVVFINLVQYVSGINFAVAVEYNGEQLGYIENEAVFEQAQARLQDRMVYMSEEEIIDDIPKFTVAVVDREVLKDDSEMTDTIIKSSSGDIVQATGLSIDGKFYGAVKDGDVLLDKLDEIKGEYKTDNEDEEVTFAKDVKTERGIFKTKNLVNEEELIKEISQEENKDAYYTVVKGDTPLEIAKKNDMSLDELVSLNKGILERCMIGQQVLIKKSQAFLPVKVIRTEKYKEPIGFATTYNESSKFYKGYTKKTKDGVKGEKAVTAKVEYVDGYEVGRTILSSSVIKEPVSAVVTKGTLNVPKVSTVTSGKVSNSGFIWPVWGGYVSQRCSGGHNGIDYAFRGNGYGKPIVAAVPGKVVWAGSRGSYGNLVIIETSGGIQTWYAHCSSILVSRGQSVAQGQQIAKVGATGRSTGYHLHFRVLVNGSQRNPLSYLP